jgi:ADP-L-glycero-D-manno-heptose 6-epimerase
MIVVTGGAGLIGSAVVWTLNQQGRDDVLIVDHLGESEKWQNLRALRFKDYLEKDEFRQLLLSGRWQEPVEAIVHLGACSDTTEVDASYLADNNFAYGKLLAEYAVAHGIRMVYASSAATYGDGENGFKDDEEGMFALRPLNKYGYSKLLFDQWLHQRGWLSKSTGNGASFVGLKYSNVFGPNEYHKAHMRSMILRAFEQVSANGRVGLFKSYRPDYADGEQLRDFLYVKDAALMTLFFLQEGRRCCGLYNIGYGATRSWNELARAVFAAMALPVAIDYIDMPESLQLRYQYYTCLDIAKIRQAGYEQPMLSLEEAVADYISYLQEGRHLGD